MQNKNLLQLKATKKHPIKSRSAIITSHDTSIKPQRLHPSRRDKFINFHKSRSAIELRTTAPFFKPDGGGTSDSEDDNGFEGGALIKPTLRTRGAEPLLGCGKKLMPPELIITPAQRNGDETSEDEGLMREIVKITDIMSRSFVPELPPMVSSAAPRKSVSKKRGHARVRKSVVPALRLVGFWLYSVFRLKYV